MTNERGAADALGVALLAPAMLGLALVVLYLGRGVDARATAQSAAEAAAQAAAQERSLAEAIMAANETAHAMLGDDQTCTSPSVQVEVAPVFEPGATVTATVTCGVATTGLELVSPSIGPRHTATAYAVVDPFRGVEP